nr:hypothetical protein BHI3_17510 [Bacteriovorax sp. HI3]
MGLMYIFPVTDDQSEGDRAVVKDNTLTLKTYGLPMIFWGYLAAALSVLLIMWLASRAVIAKLLSYGEDPTMLFLGHLVQWTLILTPIVLLGFFFYEKMLTKKGQELVVTYRVFFIPFWIKKFRLNAQDSFTVDHFMDSPNMARIRNRQGLGSAEAMKHFENKGYFELNIKTDKNKSVNIDRHSRKADLLKLKELLSKY